MGEAGGVSGGVEGVGKESAACAEGPASAAAVGTLAVRSAAPASGDGVARTGGQVGEEGGGSGGARGCGEATAGGSNDSSAEGASCSSSTSAPSAGGSTDAEAAGVAGELEGGVEVRRGGEVGDTGRSAASSAASAPSDETEGAMAVVVCTGAALRGHCCPASAGEAGCLRSGEASAGLLVSSASATRGRSASLEGSNPAATVRAGWGRTAAAGVCVSPVGTGPYRLRL